VTSSVVPRRSVQIIQSYVPAYRRALFEQLHEQLAGSGVNLTVITGTPSKVEMRRGDEVTLGFQTKVRGVTVTMRRRSIRWKSVWRKTRHADLVVCELGSLVLENYPLAFWRKNRLVMWGHGYAATTKPNRLDHFLERFLMRRSRLFLAYTEAGRVQARLNGLPESHVIVLKNTVDTSGLRAAIDSVHGRATLDATSAWRIEDEDLVCAFIGALDQSKRLEFLLETADAVWREVPRFRLLIAGDGPEHDFIRHAVTERSYLRYIGRVGDAEKAQIAVRAKLILNPGRVGLVAVDSFVMGLPIVTTNWTSHAPEFHYLVNDENAVIVDDSVQAYTQAVMNLLGNPSQLSTLVEGCVAAAGELSMEALVKRFADGILGALAETVD
jgi:glycosyltransferase involved in cell wall biosynthesis